MKVKVQCTLIVEVEVPDDTEPGREPGLAVFQIEENGCPGTGVVGNAIYAAMDEADKAGVCWACNLKGKNKIIG